MALPNLDHVRSLLGLYDSSVDLTVFVALADEILSQWKEDCPAVTEERLALVQSLLIAHFYSVTYPSVTSKSIAGASESKRVSQLGSGISTTPFGQQILLLDQCGFFAGLGEKPMTVWYVGGE